MEGVNVDLIEISQHLAQVRDTVICNIPSIL